VAEVHEHPVSWAYFPDVQQDPQLVKKDWFCLQAAHLLAYHVQRPVPSVLSDPERQPEVLSEQLVHWSVKTVPEVQHHDQVPKPGNAQTAAVNDPALPHDGFHYQLHQNFLGLSRPSSFFS
jgi:hypothetical protein